MHKSGTLLALLLLASSCASSAPPRKTQRELTYDCNYEQPTGSNIMKLDCRSLQQEQEERDMTQQRLREVQMNPQPVQK